MPILNSFTIFLLLTTYLFSHPTLAITGCFSDLGTDIKWEDCLQVARQRPDLNKAPHTFSRCNGQHYFCDDFFDFSMPQGSAYGTCAFGVDLRGNNAHQVTIATWENLEREMAYLIQRCVLTNRGLGGNHTWGSFVFVSTNPIQVDTAHTCLALPGAEDYLDLGQCIASRAGVTASRAGAVISVPTDTPPGDPTMSLDSRPGPSAPRRAASIGGAAVPGHIKGGAWVLHGGGPCPATGCWTWLREGVTNPYPPGSRNRAWVHDSQAWQPWSGTLIPPGGAMVRLPDTIFQSPDHIGLLAQQVIVVWQPEMWIPTMDSTQADPDPWWIWLVGRWAPSSPALLNAADWILQNGAWRVMAGSWFFSRIVPRETVGGTRADSAQGSSTRNRNHNPPEPLSLTTLSYNLSLTSLPSPSATSSIASTSDPDDFMLQGIGYFDFLNSSGDSPDARATKRPRTAS